MGVVKFTKESMIDWTSDKINMQVENVNIFRWIISLEKNTETEI